MIDINQILEIAPAKISEYAEKENQSYASMLRYHEEYKRLRAKTYLESRVKNEMTVKDLEYTLDTNEELCKVKDLELNAEIDYRAWRTKKEKAENTFQSALELGRNKRSELRALGDTIPEKEG